jgi:predicted membrane channel-forming protein YqfA (hemolysin III family)
MRGFIAAFVLIVIGIAIAAASGGRVALVAVGVFIAGVGSVVGVSAAFWIIGRSEDRDRERGGS